MAAPAWATDLTDIDLDPTATTSYTVIQSSGPAGLNAETDFYVQGGGTPSCLSKNAWVNAVKGACNDTDGTPWTVPTDGVLLIWGFYAAAASLATKSSGGFRIVVGDSATVFHSYYVGGSDTLTFESWVPYVVDPNNATADATAGTPSGTWSALGCTANLPTSAGPTKGAPFAIDALRYGRHTLEYTLGDGSPDYNTFTLAEATANSLANRWGNIEFNKGVFFVQGFHSFGTSGTVVDFRDSDRVVFIRDCANNLTDDAVSTAYNRFEIINASSNVDWTNILFQSLGTRSPGTFIHTAGTFDCIGCQFVNVGAFTLLSTSALTNCVFRNTGVITAPGSDLQDSLVAAYEGTADTSVVVWNVATDPVTNLSDMTFEMGTASTHAIEFGTSSPLSFTLTDCTFTGYNTTTDDQNDSTLNILRTSGTVTISIVGSGTPAANMTARSAGATVVFEQNVAVTFDGMKDLTEVRIFEAGTDTELQGIEDATAGSPDDRSFVATVSAATSVDYVLHNILYETIRVEAFTWPSTATTINVQQRFDRNNDNPA